MSLHDDWIDVHTLPDGGTLQKSATDSSYRVKGSMGNSLGIFTKVGREMERLAMRVRELEGAFPPVFPPTTRWESETQRHLSAIEIDLRAAEQKIAALLVECLPENGPSISTRLERIRDHLQGQVNRLVVGGGPRIKLAPLEELAGLSRGYIHSSDVQRLLAEAGIEIPDADSND